MFPAPPAPTTQTSRAPRPLVVIVAFEADHAEKVFPAISGATSLNDAPLELFSPAIAVNPESFAETMPVRLAETEQLALLT